MPQSSNGSLARARCLLLLWPWRTDVAVVEEEETTTTIADGIAVVVDEGAAAEAAIATRNAIGILRTPALTALAIIPVVEGITAEEAEGLIPAMTAPTESARLLRLCADNH